MKTLVGKHGYLFLQNDESKELTCYEVIGFIGEVRWIFESCS